MSNFSINIDSNVNSLNSQVSGLGIATTELLTLGQYQTPQLTSNFAGTGALVYDIKANQFKGKINNTWEELLSKKSKLSDGPQDAIQISDGNGSLSHHPIFKITKEEDSASNPITRFIVDATNTPPNFEPNARIRFMPHLNPVTAATFPAKEGDLAYFEDSLLGIGRDLYFNNGTNWVSVTGAGAPSRAGGQQHMVQLNATGTSLGGTSDFTFNTTNNTMTLNADSTLTGEISLHANISAATKINIHQTRGLILNSANTSSGISLNSLGTSPMSLSTTSSDLEFNSNSGDINATTAQGNISLTATGGGSQQKNISFTAAISKGELLSDTSSYETYFQLSNTATGAPSASSWTANGIRIASGTGFSGYDTGSGASLHLEGTQGINQPRRATFELQSRDLTNQPFTPVKRVFIQSGSTQFGGSYKALFAHGVKNNQSGTNNIPTPTNLGDGNPLRDGQFYIGEKRGRPHIHYNLSSNNTPSAFSTYNIAESTLRICDSLEQIQYLTATGLSYGGNLSLYPSSGNIAKTQIRGDGLTHIGYQSGTHLIRLDGTATGSNAGGLITLENHSYQQFGNPLASGLKLDATGTNPEIVVGTSGIGGPIHGKLRITQGINDSIVADGGPNGVNIWDGKLHVGSTNAKTIILGGKNTSGSSGGLRSIEADGSLLANGIGHISYGTWSGTTYDQRADLCLGGTPGVIPDAGQPTSGENNPNFMIRTQKRGVTTETYPALILNRYLGPSSTITNSRKLQGVMYLNRSTEGGPQGSEKNRVQLGTGDPYDGIPHFMLSLV